MEKRERQNTEYDNFRGFSAIYTYPALNQSICINLFKRVETTAVPSS